MVSYNKRFDFQFLTRWILVALPFLSFQTLKVVCNKSLIDRVCSGPYWENIGPRSFLYGSRRSGSVCAAKTSGRYSLSTSPRTRSMLYYVLSPSFPWAASLTVMRKEPLSCRQSFILSASAWWKRILSIRVFRCSGKVFSFVSSLLWWFLPRFPFRCHQCILWRMTTQN